MDCQPYTIRLAEKSDQKKWDDYVTSHPESSPYHLFAWKNAAEEAYGHKSYYLLAEKNKMITGVLPLIHLRLPFVVNELVALPFCDVGSVLCNNENISDLLLSEAVSMGKRLKTHTIHIRGQIDATDFRNNILRPEKINKVRMFLNLPESSEALMNSFKSKLRSQIRKSEKNGLTFNWGNSEKINDFYTVFSENMRDLGSPVHSKLWFRAIFKNFRENAYIGIVKLAEKPIGSCIILTIGDKVSIPWASTLRKYNRLAPNMLLYWNVLKYSSDNGFKLFDFGRSSQDEGTYKFKAQWGAKPKKLEWFSTDFKGAQPLQLTQKSSKRQYLEKVWQKSPLSVANFLGPIVRKYISL